MAYQQRTAVRESNLSTVSVATKCNVEAVFADIEQPGRSVHEDQADVLSSGERWVCVRLSGCVIVETTQTNALEWSPETDSTDARGSKGPGHRWRSGPVVMVAEHREPAEWCVNAPRQACQSMGMTGIDADEVSTEEDEIRTKVGKSGDRNLEQRPRRCRTCVKV